MSKPREPRRCDWCAVRLRWWQFSNCRVCRIYIAYNMPAPPCSYGERRNAEPDHFPKRTN